MAAATNDLGLADALVSGRDVYRRSLVKVLDCVVMVVAGCVTTNSLAPAPSTEADDTPQPLNGSTNISQVVPVQCIGGRHSVPLEAWARFATASQLTSGGSRWIIMNDGRHLQRHCGLINFRTIQIGDAQPICPIHSRRFEHHENHCLQ